MGFVFTSSPVETPDVRPAVPFQPLHLPFPLIPLVSVGSAFAAFELHPCVAIYVRLKKFAIANDWPIEADIVASGSNINHHLVKDFAVLDLFLKYSLLLQ